MPVTPHIDPVLAPLLMEASIQAYNAYSETDPAQCACAAVSSPAGYELVDSFTGVDAVLGAGFAKCFGIVYRSLAAPWTYVFAFRGTYTILDAIEDLSFWELARFVPADAAPPQPAAEVGGGFWGIYADTATNVTSMQQQVFALLDKYRQSAQPPAQILITGHSLGGALSTLFALDVALSAPSTVPWTHINYASPQVGVPAFAALYDQHVTGTVRVQNTYDIVPCSPSDALGFRHVGDAFLVAFYQAGWKEWIDPLAKYHDHQAINYQAVLNCAVTKPGQVCVSDHLDVPSSSAVLVSRQPDPSTLCSWWP